MTHQSNELECLHLHTCVFQYFAQHYIIIIVSQHMDQINLFKMSISGICTLAVHYYVITVQTPGKVEKCVL